MDFMHECVATEVARTLRSEDVTQGCMPGTPTDNAFIESSNGGVRGELLNPSYFETLDEARRTARIWRAK